MTLRPPRLVNLTAWVAELIPTITSRGWALLLVAKRRFRFADRWVPIEGARIRHGDELYPAEEGVPRCGARYPHDLAPRKVATDLVVIGDAVSPTPVREILVAVAVLDRQVQLRVLGPRTWQPAMTAVRPTDPLAFDRAPIRWEFAYGGQSSGPAAEVAREPANPLGRGAGVAEDLLGMPVAHVEDPDDPIRVAGQSVRPAGLGPVPPDAQLRADHAGTYDESWRRERMPAPPLDQDLRFHQVAIEPLQLPLVQTPLPVRIIGMHSKGGQQFEVPEFQIWAEVQDVGGVLDVHLAFDTLVVEPNVEEAEMTFRASIPWSGRSTSAVVQLRSRP